MGPLPQRPLISSLGYQDKGTARFHTGEAAEKVASTMFLVVFTKLLPTNSGLHYVAPGPKTRTMTHSSSFIA